MQRNLRITLFVLLSLVAGTTLGVDAVRVRAMQDSAKSDNYRVWITLLKGFGGGVFYVGSDDTHAYFRIGRLLRSYYKMPACAAHLPETYSLLEGEPYAVKLHIDASNSIHAESSCPQPVSYPLGNLDRE